MYTFIVNPNSRSGAGEAIWQTVREQLRRRAIPYKAYMTRYPGHAVKIARSVTANATEENPVRLIAMGGDGTIHEVLSGIRNLKAVLFGFIPTGSGNDFCRGMEIPKDPVTAFENILNCETPASLDVPYVLSEGRHHRFGISAGIGYDAAVCHEVVASPAKKILNRFHLGKLVYLVVALKQMMFITPDPAVIRLDGDRTYRFDKMYFAAVMNQKYEGGGFKFCPDAAAGDGILDVIAVEGMSRIKMLIAFPTALWGGHTKVRGIHIMQCKQADIASASAESIHLDGEAWGVGKKLSVRLEKDQLKVLI